MFTTAIVVPKLCAAWSGIWFSAGKRVFSISLCPSLPPHYPGWLWSHQACCSMDTVVVYLGGKWLGHRGTTHLHLILRLRNYMSHPTICRNVVDRDNVTTQSSLSLQFFMLVSGRIPQLHILAKLFHMTLLLKKLVLGKIIKKNCVSTLIV